MRQLTEFSQTNIFLGDNVELDLKNLFKEYNIKNKRILLITGVKSFDGSFFYTSVMDSFVEYNNTIIQRIYVRSNPQESQINKYLDLEDIDYIFCIGGGSVIDFGKALKLKQYKQSLLFVFYTLPGSGSAITPFTIFNNNNFKIGEYSLDIIPNLVYVNEIVIQKIPDQYKIISYCDIFAHAIESYYSSQSSNTSRTSSKKALNLLCNNRIEDFSAVDIIYADFYAATAETEALVLFPHAAGHYLSYTFNTPHPIASIYYLKPYLELLRKKNLLVPQTYFDYLELLTKYLHQSGIYPNLVLNNRQKKELLLNIDKYMHFAFANAPVDINIDEYELLLENDTSISKETLCHKINDVINIAKRSKLYADKLRHLKEISAMNLFDTIPFTSKQDLRQSYPYNGLCVSLDDVIEVHTTSGTTGVPTLSFFTKRDLENGSKAVAKAWRAFGISNKSRVQFIMSYGLFSGAMLNTYALQELGAFVIPAGIQSTEKQVKTLIDFEVDTLVATPGYLLYLIEYFNTHKVDRKLLKLKRAIAAGEVYSEAVRQRIEEGLGITVYDHYGLCEVYTGIAYECEERDGLHILDEYVYAEIINPETGEVLEDNKQGELVLTTLGKEASPVLRYRTGDVTQIIHEKCKCGLSSPRIRRIQGRSDDIIFIKGIKISPNELKDDLIKSFGKYIFGGDIVFVLKKNSIKFIPQIKLCFQNGGNEESILSDIQEFVKEETGVTFDVIKVDSQYFNRENSTKVRLVEYID